jgi:hypothetical protein
LAQLASKLVVDSDFPQISWNPKAHPSYGTCERHGYFVQGILAYDGPKGPIYLCAPCADKDKLAVSQSFRFEIKVLDLDTVQNIGLRRILSGFRRLKTLFDHTIGSILMVADNTVLPEEYKDKINVVVELQQFTVLPFFVWARAENSNIVSLWNSHPDVRGKFWSQAMLRLIIELATIDTNSSNIAVWVMTFGRATPMKCFTSSPTGMCSIPNGSLLYRIADFRVNQKV